MRAFALAAASFALAMAACTDDAASERDATVRFDAAADAADAFASRDVPRLEAAALDAGRRCAFSSDCALDQYCDCLEPSRCACVVGNRGSGRVGLDACERGRECVSGLCAEARPGESYCTGPCDGAEDCAGALPVCGTIPGVGRGCIAAPAD